MPFWNLQKSRGSFSPSQIAGLVLWLQPGVGMYQDAGGSTPAVLTGDPVGRWDDQSGQGNNLTQGVAPNRPVLQLAELNGYPAVLFDGSNDELTIANVLGIGATSGRTFIAVTKLVSLTARSPIVTQGQGGSTLYFAIETNTSGTVGSRWGYYVTGSSYDANIATSTSYVIVSAQINNMNVGQNIIAASTYRVAEVTATLTLKSGGGLVTNFSAAANTSIGKFNGAAVAGNVYITEVLVYDSSLALSDLQQIETYLSNKYGI